jgi:hypothetical protein
MSISNVAKLEQLKHFCPNCKDEVDKEAVLSIVHEEMRCPKYDLPPKLSDPIIIDEDTIYCCSQCFAEYYLREWKHDQP